MHWLRTSLKGVNDPVHPVQVEDRGSVPHRHVDMHPSCGTVKAVDEGVPLFCAVWLCGPRCDAIFHKYGHPPRWGIPNASASRHPPPEGLPTSLAKYPGERPLSLPRQARLAVDCGIHIPCRHFLHSGLGGCEIGYHNLVLRPPQPLCQHSAHPPPPAFSASPSALGTDSALLPRLARACLLPPLHYMKCPVATLASPQCQNL